MAKFSQAEVYSSQSTEDFADFLEEFAYSDEENAFVEMIREGGKVSIEVFEKRFDGDVHAHMRMLLDEFYIAVRRYGLEWRHRFAKPE